MSLGMCLFDVTTGAACVSPGASRLRGTGRSYRSHLLGSGYSRGPNSPSTPMMIK